MNDRLQEINDKLRYLPLTDLERAIYEQEVKDTMDANTAVAVKRMEEEESRREKEEIRREKEEFRREKEELRREKEDAIREKEDAIIEKEDARRRQEEARRQQELVCCAAIIMIKNSMSLGKTLEDSINYLGLSGEIRQQVLRYFNRLQK